MKLSVSQRKFVKGDVYLQLWLYYSLMIVFINMQIEI